MLPLDNCTVERFDVSIRPSLTHGRNVFTYFAGQTRFPRAPPRTSRRSRFKIGADVDIRAGGASGVLATQGGRFNGWGLYLLDGRPVFDYNLVCRPSVAG